MKARSLGSVSLPFDLSNTRPFLRLGFIFLLAMLTSCSSTKKMKESHIEKETTADKSVIQTATISSIITTEKIDTTVHLKADTTRFMYFTPWLDADTATHYQEIETPQAKVSIAIKPIFVAGRRTESQVSVTAIKKKDSITLKIDKKTEANVTAQTKTKNDVVINKDSRQTEKNVERKKFPWFWIIILLIVAVVLRLAYKKYNYGKF